MALKDNIDIQWHKTDIKLQDAQIRLAWGDFDPAFAFNSTYTDSPHAAEPHHHHQRGYGAANPPAAGGARRNQERRQRAAHARSRSRAPTPPPTAAPTPAVSTEPYIFQNEDFRNSAGHPGQASHRHHLQDGRRGGPPPRHGARPEPEISPQRRLLRRPHASISRCSRGLATMRISSPSASGAGTARSATITGASASSIPSAR